MQQHGRATVQSHELTGPDDTGVVITWVKAHPLAAFFFLAIFLEVLLAPIGYFTDAHQNIARAIEQSGIVYRSNYIFAYQLASFASDTHLGLFYLIVQPMTPTISALIICAICGGGKGVRELLSRLRPWQSGVESRTAILWWFACIAMMSGLSLIVAGMRYFVAEPGSFSWNPGEIGLLNAAGWFMAAMFLDGGGTGEELGWRGFAAPILQDRYSPVKATVILGVLWSIWHMPIKEDLVMGGGAAFAAYYIPFTIGLIALTVLMLFYSNKLGGTALIAIVMHGLYNDSVKLSGDFELRADISPFLWSLVETLPYVVIALICIFITKGRLGMPEANRNRRIWRLPNAAGNGK
jgi:uncharacterized protein